MAELCQISLLSYMNVTVMDYFPILELPEDIQALVVERVAGNSFTDLYGLRASCQTMKALAERSRVNHFTMCYPFPGDSICLLSCLKLATQREIQAHFI
ncbi:unnamed protein product [Brassica oleracea]